MSVMMKSLKAAPNGMLHLPVGRNSLELRPAILLHRAEALCAYPTVTFKIRFSSKRAFISMVLLHSSCSAAPYVYLNIKVGGLRVFPESPSTLEKFSKSFPQGLQSAFPAETRGILGFNLE